MKKILIFIMVSCLLLSGTYADNNNLDTEITIKKISKINTQIYKEVIFTRVYIRNNFSNGEEILKKLELSFNNIRKNKDVKLLEELRVKTGELLKIYKKKESLSRKERKEYNLIKNIFLRTYIELIIFGKIDI